MEIKNLVGEINPYSQKKIERAERERPPAVTSRASSSGTDKVSVSEEAKLRAAALSAATSASDVRTDRVEELKAQVQAGTYVPDNRKTAQNLIRDDLDLLL